ncbi:apolipoprotein N-acyltransferase [bacterium]|nr:apolipoprotein N-acyltransferase [bacterium]
MIRRGWLAALVGGLVLGLSAPGAALPFAEWLVLPGLSIWFAVAVSERRPLLRSYLFGIAYMAWFSWSVRHVMLPAYLAIVFLGGLYFVIGTAAVRGLPQRWRSLAFAVAVAGSFWMRATMPDIHYPHGQPCHALWQWPSLMRIVTVGGEPLMNALLGLLAAYGFELWQSWRVALPAWRLALVRFGGALAVTALSVVVGHWLAADVAPAPATEAVDRSVRIVAVEPGFHPSEVWFAEDGWQAAYKRLTAERLVAPTLDILKGEIKPDLILWPENSVMSRLSGVDIDDGRVGLFVDVFPKVSTRLVTGASISIKDFVTPGAVLVDLQDSRVLAHHHKQRLVPGGEFLPLVGLLPESWANSVRQGFQEALGTPANQRPGLPRPPMQTADGVPFGALLCYDNAFPEPAAAQVAAGAEFLVVLSNEAWYRGGAELTQLVAMTVVRALENVVPVVRCTLDGHTVAVDASGQVVAGLDIAAAPQPSARFLEVLIDPSEGRVPGMAWLRRSSGLILGLLTALAAAGNLLLRAIIRSDRTSVGAVVR